MPYKCSEMLFAAVVAASGPLLAQYQVPNPAYNAPAGYYSTASGTGTTLKGNLNAIIDGHTTSSYDQAKDRIPVLDQDPNNTANVLLVYSGYSVQGPWSTNGTIWNREHCWCDSYGIDGTSPAYGDLFNLRPADPGVNSDRGNEYYNDVPVAIRMVGNTDAPETWEDTSNTMWEPRPIEKGDLARNAFYMDTRYEGDASDGFVRNLQLVSDVSLITSSNNNFGKLSALLKWHYQDGVSNVERRRNNIIYTDYQNNRNPFVDHPEYVWAVFGLQDGQGNNSSQLSVAMPTSDGSSSASVSLRCMKNGTLGSGNITLSKSGVTPTTYDITTTGDATSAQAGVGQAFDYNSQSRPLTASLSSSTATTGLKTGTLVIDNTDLTSLGAGQGSADGNDTITVNGQVVDNRTITATAYSGRVIRTSSIPVTLNTTGDDDHFTRPTVKGNASSADANGSFIAAGSDVQFNSAASTASRSITADFATVGAKSGTLNFTMQAEGLAGEAVNPLSVSYSVTAVDHSEASFSSPANTDAMTVNFDYVPVGFLRSASFSVKNLQAASGQTAWLDINTVTPGGDAAQLTTTLAPTGASPIAGGAQNNYSVSSTLSTSGTLNATWTLGVSDENIPGATSGANLVLTTTGRFIPTGSFPVTGMLNLLAGENWDCGPASIAAGVMLTRSGPGTLNITGAQSNGANSTLALVGGITSINTDAGAPSSYPLSISTANAGTLLHFNASQHLAALSIGASTTADLLAGGDKTLVSQSLSITSGNLDLADNKMIVDYSGSTPAATLRQYLINGRGGTGLGSQTWAGSGGITSSAAANADPTGLAVGYREAQPPDFDVDAVTSFGGESVDDTALLIRYTYSGDANLDGKVDRDDLNILSNSFGQTSGIDWLHGDFDYNGTCDRDDFNLLSNNFGTDPIPSSSMLTAMLGANFSETESAQAIAVPEPVVSGVFFLLITATLQRRHRRFGHGDRRGFAA